MKAVRQCVERAVRPVQASTATKDRMRAELSEHLELLYQQELDRVSDPAIALEQATRRFGDPQELTRELQASVPHWERWAFSPIPGSTWGQRRSGEGVGAWILRTTTAGSLATGVMISLVIVSIASWERRTDRLLTVAPFLIVAPLLMWATLIANFWCCELIRRQLERPASQDGRMRRRLRIVAIAVGLMAFAALAPAILAVMARFSVRDAHLFTNGEAALGCLAWAVLMGVILTTQVRDWISRARRYELWDSLDLEAESSLPHSES